MTEAERRGDFSSNLGACLTVGTNQVPQLNPNGTPSGNCVRVGQIFDPATTVANPLFNPAQAQSAFNPQFIRQPFTNNQIPTARISQQSLRFINTVQPLPNFAGDPLNNFTGPSGSNFINDQFSVREYRIAIPLMGGSPGRVTSGTRRLCCHISKSTLTARDVFLIPLGRTSSPQRWSTNSALATCTANTDSR
jgi:hypothetical protein